MGETNRAWWSSSAVACEGWCGRGVPIGIRLCEECAANEADTSARSNLRWQVTWRYGGPDLIAWLCIVAGVGFLAACVATGWALGAALVGVMCGFVATLYAFTTSHFRMSTDRRGERYLRGHSGRHSA